MKRMLHAVLQIAFIFAASAPLSAAAESKDIHASGWVSDESCGAEHTKPGGEDCIRKCIKGAPHLNPEWTAQRMVFVTDEEHEIWIVGNPKALTGDEGKHMRITGELDIERNTVHVRDKSTVEE